MRYVLPVIVLSLVAGFASADVFNMGQGLTSLEMVPVGNPVNAADASTGCGSVGYVYSIGKYEITAAQYCEFLNAKANKTNSYGLYDPGMWSNVRGCKIQQTLVGNNLVYGVAAEYANRPVSNVSFWDAVRFVNWLHNGQGNGDTETGAYTLNGYNGIYGSSIVKNADAKWWIPSEDEWYKAAYHDKTAGVVANYFIFPTSTNSIPGYDLTDDLGNNANYSVTNPIDSGKYTTLVSEFQNSDSPYNTFDQGGNVMEWNSTIIGSSSRGNRGGAFGSNASSLMSSYRGSGTPSIEGTGLGFRVASIAIPEPSTLAMLLFIAVGGLLWWKRGCSL